MQVVIGNKVQLSLTNQKLRKYLISTKPALMGTSITLWMAPWRKLKSNISRITLRLSILKQVPK